ncbi:hypothetical protein AB6E04_09640 [Vibrio amylolyticus]|uniref:hypothetical protein n=1 Tax=Vibrio amylolyticus TaxID=2847292 RepID=UPI0035522D08
MKKSILTIATVAVLAGSLANVANACSYFSFEGIDGNEYIGRTNELPYETEEHFVIVPQGFEMRDSTTKHDKHTTVVMKHTFTCHLHTSNTASFRHNDLTQTSRVKH